MNFENIKIHLDGVSRETLIVSEDYRRKIIDWLTSHSEDIVSGNIISITVGGSSWYYEIVSFDFDDDVIYLKWLRSPVR